MPVAANAWEKKGKKKPIDGMQKHLDGALGERGSDSTKSNKELARSNTDRSARLPGPLRSDVAPDTTTITSRHANFHSGFIWAAVSTNTHLDRTTTRNRYTVTQHSPRTSAYFKIPSRGPFPSLPIKPSHVILEFLPIARGSISYEWSRQQEKRVNSGSKPIPSVWIVLAWRWCVVGDGSRVAHSFLLRRC